MDFNKDKYKKMLKDVQTVHKNIEEHCNYQIIVRELFRRIEEEFEDNPKNPMWSSDWNKFKEKILKER